MKRLPTKTCGLALFLCAALALGQDTLDKEEAKPDLSYFSEMIHKMVVPSVPKFYEDLSGWTGSIPVPPDLVLPRLRTYIKVGDRVEVPHGLWKKYRIWIDDPARDVRINLRELKKLEDGGFRLSIEASALVHGEGEVKPWQKGLGLPIVKADADIVVHLNLEVDVKLTLLTDRFPPDVTVEPWIVASKLELKEFNLKKISSIISIEGGGVTGLGNELKGVLNGLIQQYEEDVTDRANQAIARGLREGKGKLSTGEMLKIFKGK